MTSALRHTLPLLALLLPACGPTPEAGTSDETNAAALPDTLTVTPAQMTQGGFRLARLQHQTVEQTIQVTGRVEVPPSNLASISAPLAGFIRQADWLQGMRVRKGQVLTVVDNPDLLIPMQQQYLEARARLDFLQAEYTRNRTLVEAEVGAERALQQVDAERKQLQARVAGLAAQLTALGVAVDHLSPAHLQRQVAIRAPISGIITQVHINLGKRIEPTDVLFEIVDPAHLHIELRVFEQDLARIRKGQQVHVTLSNQSGRTYPGTVYVVNPALDEGQGARVHVHLDDEAAERNLLPGMHLSASLVTDRLHALTIPAEAVLTRGNATYLLRQVAPDQYQPTPVGVERLNPNLFQIRREGVDTTAQYLLGNVSLLIH